MTIKKQRNSVVHDDPMIVETLATPFFFSIQLTYGAGGLRSVDFVEKSRHRLVDHPFSHVTSQLARYCNGEKVAFDLPLVWPGLPPFTRRILRECAKIPYGRVVTYRDIAARCGDPRAARAAGNALRRNPFPVVVPCHRVIGSDGGLHGFMGTKGVEIKRCLLELEKALLNKGKGGTE